MVLFHTCSNKFYVQKSVFELTLNRFNFPENMGLDFDVKTFCLNLKATKPPYECPVKECGKVYKSFCGIQFHLYNFDHDNPQSYGNNANGNVKSTKKKGKWQHHRSGRKSPSPPEFLKPPAREGLSYAEAQKMVEVDLDGQIHRINIYEPLDVLMVDGPEDLIVNDKFKVEEKPPIFEPARGNSVNKTRKDKENTNAANVLPAPAPLKLPEANFRIIDDLQRPDVPVRLAAYYRFIEKSVEELDEEVEYDMDEEDCAWLELINKKRQMDDLPMISADSFELLMDRLEKESYFQSQSTGKDPNPSIDEDAVCCICNDGECQNSNVILFCDMCNLAVHQECYGVPYIPEGQWLCRRCLQSPSRAVDCALCPNKGGAFKQTDKNGWAHVVCALWIPEVQFANTVFLEPIDSIKNIPAARWKLSCYICKQRGVGACIQCHKANCYTAFHVTCAQQAGLHMKMEPVRDVTAASVGGSPFTVRKTAYCDVHTPAENESAGSEDGDGRMDSVKKAKAKAKSRLKMRKARKILAEKRSAVPVVSIPKIPPERLNHIAQMVNIMKKTQYLQRLLAYWTLKRQSRNGVPLLRRLQSTQQSRRNDFQQNESDKALRNELKYWQRLRQDLERARLLVELIRKREKLKRELIKVKQLEVEMKLQPFIILLREALDLLQDKDPSRVFAEPVEIEEVPDYTDYIKHPMDFSTMKQKLECHQYTNMDDFDKDFNLIVSNCMSYNSKDTMFYRAATKMRDQGGAVIRQVRRQVEMVGYDNKTGTHLPKRPKIHAEQDDDKVIESIDNFLHCADHESLSLEELLKASLDLLDLASNIKHGGARIKRVKALKNEITVIRRKLAMQASGKVIGKKSSSKTNSHKSHHVGNKTQNAAQSQDSEGLSSDSESDISENGGSSSSLTEDTPVRTRNKYNPSLPKGTSKSTSSSSKLVNVTPGSKSIAAAAALPKSSNTTPRATRQSSSSQSPPPSPKLDLSTPTNIVSNTSRGRRPSTVAASKAAQKTIFSSNRAARNAARAASKRRMSDSERSSPPPKRVETPAPESQYPTTPPKSNTANTGGSCSSSNGASSTGSPSGVNRRTAVLFKKKLQSISPADSSGTDFKHPANPLPSPSSSSSKRSSGGGASLSGRSKRTSTYEGLASGPYIPGMDHRASSRKKSSSHHKYGPSIGGPVMFDEDSFSMSTEGDSFKVYRCGGEGSDSDNNSETSSTSDSASDNSQRSDFHQSGESDSDDDSEHRVHSKTRSGSWGSQDNDFIPLEPLDLVWAKCRGYPWYPALIINPKMPKTGYFHNGVPIPVPPDEVLALQKTFNDYLVLFFDTKRTWQWLPRHKLEPLGVDMEHDKTKLIESRKPTEKKAVKIAYEKAILHRCRVTGQSNALSEDGGPTTTE
ncbi:Peregrin [Nymphon striatum]|nr:Peregrin [Nymphon striatum]